MKVLITGSASRLAAALLPKLAADARVKHLIGVDRREPAFRDARYTQVLLDTRSNEIAAVLKDVDAVVHLATSASLRLAERRAINVAGTQNVARSAMAQGVRQFIFLSTAAVYELPPRTRVIDESHPRRAWPGLGYAEDCMEIEVWLDGWEREQSALSVIRLRPHLVVGPHAPSLLRMALAAPVYIPLTDRPRLQCVHEDDVVQAIMSALYHETGGAFNLACADSATLEELKRMRHRWLLPLAFPLARTALRLAAHAGSDVSPAWLEALRYNIVLNTTRARKELHWRPRHDSIAACLDGATVKKNG